MRNKIALFLAATIALSSLCSAQTSKGIDTCLTAQDADIINLAFNKLDKEQERCASLNKRIMLKDSQNIVLGWQVDTLVSRDKTHTSTIKQLAKENRQLDYTKRLTLVTALVAVSLNIILLSLLN